jgi:F-type H+-transporting ATPase subunit b
MPQFDLATFPSQIFWLVLSFVVLYLLMSRVALPRIGNVLSEREERIEDNLSAAEELRNTAKADAEAYDKALATARDEARGAIQQAANAVSQDAAAKQEALQQRLAQQIKTSEAEIERAKAGARASIREAAVGVAQAAVQRLIGVNPNESQVGAAVDNALRGRS